MKAKKLSLSEEDKKNIAEFRKRKIGFLSKDNFYRSDYYGVIYMDYKGEPCTKAKSVSRILFKARLGPKGFVLFTPKVYDPIFHDKLLTQGIPSVQRKIVGQTRNNKIVRSKARD